MKSKILLVHFGWHCRFANESQSDSEKIEYENKNQKQIESAKNEMHKKNREMNYCI